MAFTRMVSDYSELVHALRDRAIEMQISRLDLDEIGGLTSGHSSKLLSSKPAKIFGPISLGPMLEVLGLRVVLVEDTGLTRATQSRRTPVDQSNQRFGNKNNSRPQLKIESSVEIPRIAAPPRNEPTSHSHLRVIQDRRRGSKWG